MSEPSSNPLVSPFFGERYSETARLSNLIAPPYDAISPAQRQQLAGRHQHNIVRLILPEGNGDRYEQAARTVREWRAKSILTRDADESVYVVRQECRKPDGQMCVRTGVIGAIAVEPFSKGRIKPHVKTHAEPKVDRLRLLRATNSMFEALLFIARDEAGELRSRLNEAARAEPTARAELEGVHMTVWQVSGDSGRAIAQLAGEQALYLADGHHRYETALAYRELNPIADRTLGLVVPLGDPGLTILAMHRLIHGDSVDVSGVIDGLRQRFQVHELTPDTDYVQHLHGLRDRGTACAVVREGGWSVSLLLKAGANLGDLPFANEPTVASLDVALIDELVVRPLMTAAGKKGSLEYSADTDSVIQRAASGAVGAAVMLNPTSVEQVLAVADAGAVMPQKATYFTPKVPGGLVTLSWAERVEQQAKGA